MKKIILMSGALATLFLAGCSNNQTKSDSKHSVKSSNSMVIKHKKPVKQKKKSIAKDKTKQVSQTQLQNKQKEEKKTETNRPTVKKMNFNQIQNGDFSSLSGTWKLVKRITHHKDETAESSGEILNVTPTMISDRDMSLTKDGIKGSSDVLPVTYSMNGTGLVANLEDQSAIVNYAIYFYPAGSRNIKIDGEFQIPPSKNTIVTWSSLMNSFSVYEQQ